MKQQVFTRIVGIGVCLLMITAEALAIPAFSRKYKIGCNMCHTVFPRLNDFGRDFKNNGYRTPDELPPAVAHDTTNFWDKGIEDLPLTVHGKINQEISPTGKDNGTNTVLDELQLNAGIVFNNKVSFYLHTHLVEEGEPGRPLIAAVRINDLFGSPLVNLRAGQYELPLTFSPEVELLTAFPYMFASQTIGDNRWSLAQPQLGLELTGNLGNDFWYWAGVVNGSGFEVNQFTNGFDNNSSKDPYFRLAKNFDENTIGIFGYFGNNGVYLGSPDSLGLSHSDRFYRVGGDINWNFSSLNVRTSLMYGRDKNYDGLKNATAFYGGFVECDYYPTDRLVLLARYDVVQLDNPAAAGAGEDSGTPPATKKTTFGVTPGFQYLILPNIKVGFEYRVRRTRDEDRAMALLHFAL